MKKLLYIVEAMGGGVFTYIVDLTNGLADFFEIFIAYAVRPQTPVDFRKKFDKRIHLIEVQNFVRLISPAKDIKALFEIRKIADTVKPDLIHLHSSKAGVIGRWAFNGKRIPLFYTPHGYSFLMTDQNIIKRKMYKAVELISSKRNCTVISCSMGEHHETLNLTPNATYVNNGVNTKELQVMIDNTLDIRKKRFTVFTLGRICFQKNPRLFNKIAEAMPDVRFMWIGDGEMSNELMASNIEITGWAERDAAIRYSLSADVFILTSLWEGLPMSLLEAMYMKKLCVVSDVIGNRDVISNGVNGYVCDCVSDYVEAIRTAQNRKCNEIIDRAYKDSITQYNTTVMVENYVDLYRKALFL